MGPSTCVFLYIFHPDSLESDKVFEDETLVDRHNASAAICGLFYSEQISIGKSVSDSFLKQLFKKTFYIKMAATSCGYGSATDCGPSTCLIMASPADWHHGFFEWIEEELFDCNDE